MKFDMGGAGAALGAASAIGALKPKGIEVWNQSSYSQFIIEQGWTGRGEYTMSITALKTYLTGIRILTHVKYWYLVISQDIHQESFCTSK